MLCPGAVSEAGKLFRCLQQALPILVSCRRNSKYLESGKAPGDGGKSCSSLSPQAAVPQGHRACPGQGAESWDPAGLPFTGDRGCCWDQAARQPASSGVTVSAWGFGGFWEGPSLPHWVSGVPVGQHRCSNWPQVPIPLPAPEPTTG